jgi:hypothetical protein
MVLKSKSAFKPSTFKIRIRATGICAACAIQAASSQTRRIRDLRNIPIAIPAETEPEA